MCVCYLARVLVLDVYEGVELSRQAVHRSHQARYSWSFTSIFASGTARDGRHARVPQTQQFFPLPVSLTEDLS